MAENKNIIKGIDSTRLASVKSQGQPKERPETARQVTITKPPQPAPAPPKKEK